MTWMDGLVSKHGRLVIVLGVVLSLAGAVHADLMPLCCAEAGFSGWRSSSGVRVGGASVVDAWLGELLDLDALSAGATGLFDVRKAEGGSAPILVDRSSSFVLCLYALIGLGVFRSCHWVKRSSLGFVPEWYHSGAPRQIGHSHAVGPDALCPATACFIQPDGGAECDTPRQRRGMITALWRRSQFARCVLASRAPPPVS